MSDKFSVRQIALIATESANLRLVLWPNIWVHCIVDVIWTLNISKHNLKNNTTDKTFSLVVCTIMYQF